MNQSKHSVDSVIQRTTTMRIILFLSFIYSSSLFHYDQLPQILNPKNLTFQCKEGMSIS